jgi:hypothetical protein
MEGTAPLALAASFDRLVVEPSACFTDAAEEEATDELDCGVTEGVNIEATEEVGFTNEDTASLRELCQISKTAAGADGQLLTLPLA